MIQREPPPWNKDAAELLKQFFATGVGELFLAQLAAGRPTLLSGAASLEATALQAREAAGFERAINLVLSLQEAPVEPTKEPDHYPPLEDDAQWEKEPPKN